MLNDTNVFAPPDSRCLSPAGEYNLRLGIMKQFQPDLVATYTSKPGSYNGHPFVVEAAVAFGGAKGKPGLTIYRFANRIPLLFEPGNDIVNIAANRRVKWSSYKINHKTDKVGVFVSIVSTKIPFKGTGKEYIGDDVTEMAESVKTAISRCCLQLKSKLTARRLERDHAARARNLAKYVPDCSRALFGVLSAMKEGYEANGAKRRKVEDGVIDKVKTEMISKMSSGEVTQASISSKLIEAIEQADHAMALEQATKRGRGQASRCNVHLIPEFFSENGTPEQVLFKGLAAGSEARSETIFHPMMALKLMECCRVNT
mmetsp:Transcript_17110/g.21078  ORF Transcript_17110/g.21078 Transcript_17110/m.21078 type:complete len:315 (-) Transcript_17110:742-1686(-)